MPGQFIDDAATSQPQFIDDAPRAGTPQFIDDAKGASPKPQASAGPVKPQPTATAFPDDFSRAAKDAGINEALLRAVHPIEDPSEDPNIVSPHGAIGEMQMLPGTFKDFARPGENIDNPRDNIEVSARYFAFLNKHYKGDLDKVFAAYNAGQGAVDKAGGVPNFAETQAYVKQARANYDAFVASVEPPKQTQKLSKGTQKAAPEPEPPASVKRADFVDQMDRALDAVAGALPQDMVQGAGQAARYATEYDQLPAPVRKKLEEIASSPQAQTTGRYLSNVVSTVPEAFNIAMRDLVLGRPENMGQVGNYLRGVMKDPHLIGTFLNRMNERYGVNSADEIKFWARLPGYREAIANAKGVNPDNQLQTILALHADYARFLASHDGVRDLTTFVESLMMPAPPVGLLARGGKFLGKKGAQAMGKGIDSVGLRSKVDEINETAGKAFDDFYTNTIFGDRFHSSKKAAGAKGEAEHFHHATQQARMPEHVANFLNQENKYNNTTLEQAQAIHRYQDKFNSENDTAHLLQPQGGDPHFDPLTRTTAMTRGGLGNVTYDEHMKHVFVSHPKRIRVQLPPRTTVDKELVPDPDLFRTHLRAGHFSDALQLMPSIPLQDADQFEQDLLAHPQLVALGGLRTSAGRQFAARQTRLRMIGQYLRDAGLEGGDWGDEVVFSSAQKALPRDLNPLNGASIDERAFYITATANFYRAAAINADPEMARVLIPNYHGRSGMFKEEITDAERFAGDKQAKSSGPIQANMKPATQKRHSDSIEHAEAPQQPPNMQPLPSDNARYGFGLKADPKWDPRAALMTSLVRAARYANYVNFLKKHSKPINYEKALNDSQLGIPAQWVNKSGPEGRKEFDAIIDTEAQKRLKASMTPEKYDALTAPENKEGFKEAVKQIKVPIYRQVQKAWEAKNPDMVWDLPQEAAVDSLMGLAVPKWVKNAAIDSHPALGKSGTADRTSMLSFEDDPQNMLVNAVDSVFHLMRSAFLSDPLYHPADNLAPIMLGTNELAPHELGQALMFPHTISKDIFDGAEEAGAFSPGYGAGVRGPKAQTRYKFGTPVRPIDRNLFRRNTTGLPQRMRDLYKAYKNAVGPNPSPLEIPQHILGRALYMGDRWNQDLTFKVWEDAMAAMAWHKRVKAGQNKYEAAREVRKKLGDTMNMTKTERQVGLAKFMWFYNWFKGQMRLYMSDPLNRPLLKANNAINQTLESRNQNTPDTTGQAQQLTDRGQTTFVSPLNQQRYVATVAPPPTRKLQAISSLFSTPFTEERGLMDFVKFTASSMVNDLAPGYKAGLQAMTQTFGVDANYETPGTVAEQALGAAGQGLVPQSVQTLGHGLKDPTRLIELITGQPVVSFEDKEAIIGPSIMSAKYQSLMKRLVNSANSDEGKAAGIDNIMPLLQEQQRKKQELLGR